jgi:hypothetical protein
LRSAASQWALADRFGIVVPHCRNLLSGGFLRGYAPNIWVLSAAHA